MEGGQDGNCRLCVLPADCLLLLGVIVMAWLAAVLLLSLGLLSTHDSIQKNDHPGSKIWPIALLLGTTRRGASTCIEL